MSTFFFHTPPIYNTLHAWLRRNIKIESVAYKDTT